MIFDLFSKMTQKSAEKAIDRSIDEYSKTLEEDINLMVRMIYNRKTYTTDVESINSREVVFRCPINEYNHVRSKNGNNIKIDFVSYTGLYTTRVTIVEKIIKEDITYYKGEITQPIEKKQRRDNYRLPISLDLTYTLLPKEITEYEGSTLDISVGGMLMETYENIYQTKNIKLKVDIEDKIYEIKSYIVKKRENFSNGKYFYHVKFEGLSNKQKNEISRFIFDNRKMKCKNIKTKKN